MSGNGRKLMATLAVGLGVAVSHAQTPPNDLVDRTKQKLLATESTLSSEVAEVLRTAPGVAKVDQAKAVRNLKDVRAKVDIATISGTKRDELVKQLDAAIASIQGGGAAPAIESKVDAAFKERWLRDDKNRKIIDASSLEAKEVNEAFDAIAKAIDDRRDAEAKRTLAAIAAKYPNNPSVLLLQGQLSNADAVTASRLYAQEASKRYKKAYDDVLMAALPAVKDVELAKNWKELRDFRIKLNAPKLTAEEEKLLKSLDTPIKGGLKDAPFQEAVQLLSTAIDQKIYVDTKSLEGRGVNLDDKVDVPGGVSARSALRIMLQSKGLTFVLRENVIQVVTVEDAKKQCVARAYDVRDLVSGGVVVGNLGPWGAYLDYQAAANNAQIIIDAIKKGVEPSAWEESGGVGSITFHHGTMSLIVRAPSEVHADLYRKMYK
jgi:hypothetical protein